MRTALLATLALFATTGASALTFTSVAGAPDPGAGPGFTTVFEFEAPTPELTGSFSLVSGTVPSVYAAPALDGTQYAAVPAAGQGFGQADLDLTGIAQPIRKFSLYWGSIDTYNTLEFYNGSTLVGSVTGSQLPPANGDQGAGISNRRVTVDFGGAQTLTSARFISDGIAFEFDDVAISAVPEPATWAMLVSGFGLVGFAARKRRSPLAVSA